MVLCHGSPCRLRQAGFHSPVRSSPVLCTRPIDFVQHHFPGSVWWEASGQGGAVRGRWEEEVGLDRGCLDTASWQSPQAPWQQLAVPPQHTLHPHLPARQPPSPPPALPSDSDRCEPLPSPPPRTVRWHLPAHTEPEPRLPGPQAQSDLSLFQNQTLSKVRKTEFPCQPVL